MKKEVLITILIAALLAQATEALVINEATRTPANLTEITIANATFHCEATGAIGTPSITLHTDVTGSLIENYTAQSATLDYTISNIANGEYTWKCTALEGTTTATSSLRTFTINASQFTGTIPDQNFNAGETLTNAFDLDDFFSDTTNIKVSGNSTITVTIDTSNRVSLSAANATAETITFTSGSASSNGILVTATAGTPTCATIPNQTITKGTNLTLNLLTYCTGAGNITFTAPTVGNLTVTITNGTATITPAASWAGTATVYFTAKAGSLTKNTNNITITVQDEQPQVKIESYEPKTDPELSLGDIQVFTITKSGNGTLTIKWYVDDKLIAGETKDSYTYTSTEAGSHTIKAVISNGIQEATKIWTTTVAGEENQEEPSIETESLIGEQTESSECGNDICEEDENCGNCEEDCACLQSEICQENACTPKSQSRTALIAAVIIAIVIISGGAIAYFLITKKPEDTTREETSLKKAELNPAASITDFYKKTAPQTTIRKQPAKNPVSNYIASMRARGTPDDQIKKQLAAKGWSSQQIEEAFKSSQ